MEDIFIQRPRVITVFIIPWILGLGCKTPEQAKNYVKHGKTLNPDYYPENQKKIKAYGMERVYMKFIKRLFNEQNIDHDLSKIVNDVVYKPWDCLSGIFQIEINETLGLVARPNGVTLNNECVIMVDNYFRFYTSEIKEELELKLLVTMAVWKSKKGIYILSKMKEVIHLEFDDIKWEGVYVKLNHGQKQ